MAAGPRPPLVLRETLRTPHQRSPAVASLSQTLNVHVGRTLVPTQSSAGQSWNVHSREVRDEESARNPKG